MTAANKRTNTNTGSPKGMDKAYQNVVWLRKSINEKELELEKWEHPDGYYFQELEKLQRRLDKAGSIKEMKQVRKKISYYEALGRKLDETTIEESIARLENELDELNDKLDEARETILEFVDEEEARDDYDEVASIVSNLITDVATEAETYIDGLKKHPALATAMDETEKAWTSMEKAATTVIFPYGGENEWVKDEW